MKAKRAYRDSVFIKLLKDKNRLLEVYNAIEGTSYGPETKIEINTLEGVLFQDRVNDISFSVDNRYVVLIEHQSTINENMPIRMLIYIGRLYEKLLSERDLYRKKIIPLPTPEFIVCYNGEAEYPNQRIMKLSEAYQEPMTESSLELTVKVLNINYKTQNEVLERSQTLKEYSQFVKGVRDREKAGKELGEAIRETIEWCIKQGILKDFLIENGSEVHNMLFGEWNSELAAEVYKEEGYQEGVEKERQETISRMLKKYDPKTISNVLGLSLDEVLKYQKNPKHHMPYRQWNKEIAEKLSDEERHQEVIDKGVEQGFGKAVYRLLKRYDPNTTADMLGIPVDEVLRYQKNQEM